jgi:hypothetical protein
LGSRGWHINQRQRMRRPRGSPEQACVTDSD